MTDPAHSAELLLEFAGVEVLRGARPVLAGVDLQVHAGDSWAVVGSNGAGKSSLLLAALGTVATRGGAVRRAAGLASRRAIGFVPQRLTLDPRLPTTVREFLELGLIGLRAGRRERRTRIAAALSVVHLPGHADRALWQHSEGQLQRILLARALARRPRCLLLDEPTAALDPLAAERFWELLGALHAQQGLTVLCATHDLRAVARVATRAAVCVAGRGGPGRVEIHPAAAAEAALHASAQEPVQ